MRLIITDKEEQEIEGILVKKDSSHMAIRLKDGKVRMYHWDHVKEVKRVYKGKQFTVNLESMRKGRE